MLNLILCFVLLFPHHPVIPSEAPQPRPKPRPIVKKVETKPFIVTAYTAGQESTGKLPGDKGYGVTASGRRAQEGITAACPPYLEFGTVLYIEGLGRRVCQDRGGAIKGRHIDVFMTSLGRARQFGRQVLDVRIFD